MALIEIQDVTKKYHGQEGEVQALKGVTCEIHEKEFVAVMGPSGSGKSTLLTMLGVLSAPTTGKVLIDDIDVYALSREQQADFRSEYIGFVFQQFQLIPYLTAAENVMLPLAITKLSNSEQLERAYKVLERVGLKGKESRLPSELSGGEQERVAIARAIVNNPAIVMADEPTGSLDTKTGEEILQLFKDLNNEGLTIIMVTHNPDNLRHVGRAIRIRDGRIDTADTI